MVQTIDALKIANLASGVFFVLIGVLQVISLQVIFNSISFDFFMLIFLPFFLVFFGLLMIGSSQKLDFISKYFKFLTTFLGRGVFNFFLASLSVYQLSGSTSSLLGFILGCICFTLGMVNVVLHFTSKDERFDDYREQLTS